MSELFPNEVEPEVTIEAPEAPETPESPEVETKTVETPAPTANVEDLMKELEQAQSQVKAFKTKALDEVRKRQMLEQEKPDAFAEPDKAIDFSVNQLKSDFENRFLNMSEYNAKLRHADLDKMTEVFFNELIPQNPALHQAALSHPDPYEYIYQTAKTHTEFKGIKSVDDLKAKLRAEVEAEFQAKQAEAQRLQAEKAINDALPTTLANKTAAGGNVTQGYKGPTPLNQIFKN